MTFRTICAWCGVFISEKECPEPKDCLALSYNGIMTSHGICPKCKKAVEIEYGLDKKEDSKNA